METIQITMAMQSVEDEIGTITVTESDRLVKSVVILGENTGMERAKDIQTRSEPKKKPQVFL